MMTTQEYRHRGVMLVLLVALVMGMAGGCGTAVWAQGQIGQDDPCRHNDTQEDITVSTTAVVIIAPDKGLCGALIVNTGDQLLRCRDTFYGAPTGTLGWPLTGGGVAEMTIDAQSGLQCIRDTAATDDTTVNVTLKKP